MTIKRLLGLDEPSAPVARAKLAVMSRHVPLLYLVVSIDAVLLAYVYFDSAPRNLTLLVPGAIVLACGVRALIWARRNNRAVGDHEAVRRLYAIAIIGSGIATFIFGWTLQLSTYGDNHMRDYAIMFLAINVICCIFCLKQLRLAVFLLGLIVVLPLSILLLTSSDPLGEAMGINVLLVCGAVLYLATKASYDFEDLVSAQVAAQELSDANARLAEIDALTGLANRRSLQRRLAEAQARGDGLALAIVDLDGFKAINDNCGHETGDLLIRQWALDLQATGGPECFTARLGGDEFALIVEGEDANARLEAIADAVVRRTRHPIRIGDRTLKVGATIGLTGNTENVEPAGELLRQADVAMYAAKCAGKNRFLWFDREMDSERDSARRPESDLRDAVEEDRFSLIYQPSFDARSGTIRSVEALLRWDAPADKAMGPAQFIPLAEETGLIDRLGLTMLRKACQTVAIWPDVVLAVNLSAAQLRNPQFADNVADLLAECRLSPSRLEFEIPECGAACKRDPVMGVIGV